MSQGMVGADIEQLQTLGVTLQAQAEEVRGIADLVNRYLPGAPWTGYKADVFRQQWWPQHQAQLRSIADGLHGLGQSALNNADEQRRTSDVRGFAGSAGVVGASSGDGSGMPGFKELSPILASLGLAGVVFDAASYALFLRSLGPLLSKAVNPETLRAVAKAFPDAPNVAALSKGFFLLDAGTDGYEYISALVKGDFGGVMVGTGKLLLDVGSLMNPYVAAANLGLGIGEFITDNTQLDEIMAGNIYDATVYRQYGTLDPTPSQAADLVQRYESVGGFVNYVGDSGKTAWENLTGLF